MVLTTHAIVGGAIGRVLAINPLLAFIFGFVSHFLFDAIPHWDYQLYSLTEDNNNLLNNRVKAGRGFNVDFLKVSGDAILGLVLAGLIFHSATAALWSVLAGAVGALLPDFLQFIYLRFSQREPLFSIQRFHMWIHAKRHFNNRPILGIFLQLVFCIFVVIFAQAIVASKLVILLPDLFASFRAVDLVDVTLVAAVVYFILLFIKETRSFLIANTALLLLGLYYVAEHFGLGLVRQLFQPFLAFVIVIFAIVFQRELRRFFEWFSLSGGLTGGRRASLSAEAVDALVKAVRVMAIQKIGALIVLAGDHPLEGIVEGGYVLDGRISTPLVLSIFDSSSPGHDGALLIERGRARRFGLHLPLGEHFDRSLGTRHRAALGLSERTDALVLVVSEERGTITAVHNGKLTTINEAEQLSQIISDHLHIDAGDALDYFILRNFWWKLSALIIAFGLWFSFVFQVGMITKDFSVPLAFQLVPPGLEVRDLNANRVTVSVTGSKADVLSFNESGLAANIDLSRAATGTIQIVLTPNHLKLPAYLTVNDIRPGTIYFYLGQKKN